METELGGGPGGDVGGEGWPLPCSGELEHVAGDGSQFVNVGNGSLEPKGPGTPDQV